MGEYLQIFFIASVIAYASAQWRGDIGYGRSRGGWEVSGGASYDFAKGRGKFGTQGFYDSSGNYGARATLSYRWGRRRRSISSDEELRKLCRECISVDTITSLKKLAEYADLNKVDFSMIARFNRMYQSAKETALNFDIKQVLDEPPTNFNISDAKVFNIYAEKDSCAVMCLKNFVKDDYIVTGAFFHGRLIIYDKLLMFHPTKSLIPKGQDDGEEEEESNADTAGQGKEQ